MKTVFVSEVRYYKKKEQYFEFVRLSSTRENAIRHISSDSVEYKAEAGSSPLWWVVWEEEVDPETCLSTHNCELYDEYGNVIDSPPDCV